MRIIKRFLRTIDKKLGYILFLCEDKVLGQFFKVCAIVSLSDIEYSLLLLGIDIRGFVRLCQHPKAKSLMETTHVDLDFYPNLATGFYVGARFVSNPLKQTMTKIDEILSDDSAVDSMDRVSIALEHYYKIYGDLVRPFFAFYSGGYRKSKKQIIIPYRISQFNAIYLYSHIMILGFSFCFRFEIFFRTILAFLCGLGMGYILL